MDSPILKGMAVARFKKKVHVFGYVLKIISHKYGSKFDDNALER